MERETVKRIVVLGLMTGLAMMILALIVHDGRRSNDRKANVVLPRPSLLP